MTTMKKLASLILAVMMLLSVASAATITVENKDSANKDENAAVAEEYTAYMIFSAVAASADKDAPITYKIEKASGWFSVLFNDDGTAKEGNDWFTATAIPGEDGVYQVIPADTYDNETAAKAAAAWLLANKGDNAGQELVVGTNTVADGYYLVESTLGTNLGLATTDFGMTIVEKNIYPSIDKEQKDEDITDFTNDPVKVAVGDVITYQVTVMVPATVKSDIIVTDTMSAGLTYNNDVATSVAATSGEGESAVTNWEVATAEEGETFRVVIHPTDAVKGQTIVFTFTATVNEEALIDAVKNNTVDLTYSNFYQHDTVEYDIYKAGAVKYDGDTADVNGEGALVAKEGKTIAYLAGAKFKLLEGTQKTEVKLSYNAEGNYYYPDANGAAEITTPADGKICIKGLDADKTYYLKETQAPAGYNLLTGDAQLNIVAEDAELVETNMAKIANLSGSQLPSTGGIGTTIFYAVGGLLVVLAVVMLVTKRRVGEEN